MPNQIPTSTQHAILYPALSYFLLTFLTGFTFGTVRHFVFIPLLTNTSSPSAVARLLEIPLMVLASLYWAKYIVRRYKIPMDAKRRLCVGGLAVVFLCFVDGMGRLGTGGGVDAGEEGMWERAAELAFMGSLVVFGMGPWLVRVLGMA